jgi:hypothetical protein
LCIQECPKGKSNFQFDNLNAPARSFSPLRFGAGGQRAHWDIRGREGSRGGRTHGQVTSLLDPITQIQRTATGGDGRTRTCTPKLVTRCEGNHRPTAPLGQGNGDDFCVMSRLPIPPRLQVSQVLGAGIEPAASTSSGWRCYQAELPKQILTSFEEAGGLEPPGRTRVVTVFETVP